MKLKVTKHLTYARKLYDQQPEFTFAKVGSGRPDQNSLHSKKMFKSPKSQSSKVKTSNTISQSTSSSTTSAQPQARLQKKHNSSSSKPSSGQTNKQKQTNKPIFGGM